MVLVDCHKCHVLFDGGKNKVPGRVVHTKEKVKLYLNSNTLRDARIKTKVVFYDDQQGILLGNCQLLVRRNFEGGVEQWLAECTILDLRQDEENLRRAIRIKTNINLVFCGSKHGNFRGVIQDLSVGGIRLVSKQVLNRNERLIFTYSFSGGQPIKYEVIVIRGFTMQDGNYGYGCRFVNLTDASEAAIGGYLFKIQQEKRSQL